MCILYVNFFLCYLHSILKKYLSVVSSLCFCVVFVSLFLHYLYGLFHILLLSLQIYRSMECMNVFMYGVMVLNIIPVCLNGLTCLKDNVKYTKVMISK